MLELTYETRYGDYQTHSTVKKETVLDIIQDLAIRDSKKCGYGLDILAEMNIAWMLQGINIRFEKPIKANTPIDALTAVRAMGGAISERGCILSQNGETVAKSVANWFTFDTYRMKLCKIPSDMLEAYELYDFKDNFFCYKKLRPEPCDNIVFTQKILRSHTDTNNHLNNRKSAIILMDALPPDFDYNTVNIVYKKSAYEGDELQACIKPIDKGYYVHLQTADKSVCVAGTFQNI